MNIFEERLVLNNSSKNSIISDEHLIRYEMAKSIVTDKIVLDLACGSGYGSKILAKQATKVIGMDVDATTIETNKQNYQLSNLEFRTGDALNIPESDNQFDVAISFETIEHLTETEKFVEEISRVLKPEGLALISTPNKALSQGKNPFHPSEMTREEFSELLKKHFPYFQILEQKDGIASCILIDNNSPSQIITATETEPIYFIAICSKTDNLKNEVAKLKNIASINFPALKNLQNNPILKLSDKIYPILKKIPLVNLLLKK